MRFADRFMSCRSVRWSIVSAVVCLVGVAAYQLRTSATPVTEAPQGLSGQTSSIQQGDEWIFDAHGSVKTVGGERQGQTSISFTQTELVMDKYLDDTRRVAFVRNLTHPLRGPGIQFQSIWPFRLDTNAEIFHLQRLSAKQAPFSDIFPSMGGLTFARFDVTGQSGKVYGIDVGNYWVSVTLSRMGQEKVMGINCVRFNVSPTQKLPHVLTKQTYADGPPAPKTNLNQLSGSIWVSTDGLVVVESEQAFEFTQAENTFGRPLNYSDQSKPTAAKPRQSTVSASLCLGLRSRRHLSGAAYVSRAHQLEEVVRIHNIVERLYHPDYDLILDADAAERKIAALKKAHPGPEFAPVLAEFTWRAARLRKEPEINPKYVNVPSKLLAKPAPEIAGVQDDGSSFTLSSLRGKPVLLLFFGGGYTDLDTDIPVGLTTFASEWRKKGVAIVGLAAMGRDAGSAKRIRDRLHLDFPVVWPNEASTPWERTSYKYDAGRFAVVLVDKQGIVRYKGSDLYPSEIEPGLRKALAE